MRATDESQGQSAGLVFVIRDRAESTVRGAKSKEQIGKGDATVEPDRSQTFQPVNHFASFKSFTGIQEARILARFENSRNVEMSKKAFIAEALRTGSGRIPTRKHHCAGAAGRGEKINESPGRFE